MQASIYKEVNLFCLFHPNGNIMIYILPVKTCTTRCYFDYLMLHHVQEMTEVEAGEIKEITKCDFSDIQEYYKNLKKEKKSRP